MEYKSEQAKERDLKILYELYCNRLLTIDQLSSRLGYTKGSLYHFLARLLKSRFILSKGIKGYTIEDERKGKYYAIANKGITFLRENGYQAKHNAGALRVSDMRVPYQLEVNNLEYEFMKKGWSFLDSRAVKEAYGLNRGDNLHGSLSSPVFKEYPFYLFLNNDNISDRWLNRVVREINKYGFKNVVLLTEGAETFKRVFQVMFSKAEAFTYQEFMLMSIRFGKEYLMHYVDTNLLYKFMEDEIGIVKIQPESDIDYNTKFDLVEFEGNEYYLVNMLNNNLANIHHIKQYKREKYMADGKKLLILVEKSTNGVIQYEKLMESVHHAEFIEISPSMIVNYAHRASRKEAF